MNNKAKLIGVLSLGALLLTGCGDTHETEVNYTYRTFLSTNPTTWNVHTWETSDESYIQSFTEMGLYDLGFNANKDGYVWLNEMAAAEPIMVDPNTVSDEEYDLHYNQGTSFGDLASGMIWDIPLNQNAKWEDGSAINAKTYVDSMERLLNPRYANYRADGYYSGDLILANAENYFKSGRQTIEPAYDHFNLSNGSVTNGGTGYWFINLGQTTGYFNSVFTGNVGDQGNFYQVLNNRSASSTAAVELAAARITAGVAYYLHRFVYTPGSTALEQSDDRDDWADMWDDAGNSTFRPSDVSSTMFQNDRTYIDLTEFDNKTVYTTVSRSTSWEEDNRVRYTQSDLRADLSTFVSAISRNNNSSWNWQLPLFTYIQNEDAGLEPENIGIAAIDDYTIRLYLARSITSLNLKFSLIGNWIVNVDLYDRLTQSGANNSRFTTYASGSVDNYMAYGPYKLTHYESGNRIVVERNNNWYGYTDGKHEGQFTMECLDTRIISDHNTALNEFLAGRLDDIDLTATDMRTYGNSSRRTTTYESYTQKVSFNSNRSRLLQRQQGGTAINKTILANIDFRKGLSLALDRENFASSTTGGSRAFTGLLNDLYLSNNATGETYRSTPQGRSVYNAVYSNLGGDEIGEEIALPETSYGYNRALAVQYVAKALRDELASSENGSLQHGDTVTIEFRVYDATSETTIGMYNFINTAWTSVFNEAKALAGASDINFSLTTVTDQDYYDSATNGNYDMIFSIWGGATVDPYGLMEVYCSSTFTNCCEFGFKGYQDSVTLEIDSDGDGTPEERTFQGWYQYMTSTLNEAQFGDDTTQMDDSTYAQWERVHNTKLNVLAGLEAGILNRFEAVPIVARGSSSLLSFKVENGSSSYINLIGYGGVRYMTFNYNDTEWSNWLASLSDQGISLRDLYTAA